MHDGWVQDKWHNDYNGAPTGGSSWEDGVGSYRVYRGGCWGSDARGCRSANRRINDPGIRINNPGFRYLREM
ncbi:MAG: SUMF1/EgtB/PvdO family nonheme iron enzyme [Euryarchaeota archaeon]|nr:SUMF1/EgtB/PvdO family nonheme iron enzyme [Euryarchaeota archaeon]